MPTIFQRLIQFCCCGLLLLSLVGCTGRSVAYPDLAEVNGTVTVNGKPVQNITVIFNPEAGGRASRGTTDADGKFHVMYDRDVPGAILGQHDVKFMLMDADAPANVLPRKYLDQSASMSAEVSKDRANEFTFDLKGK